MPEWPISKAKGVSFASAPINLPHRPPIRGDAPAWGWVEIHSLAEFPKEFENWQPSNVFSVADTLARIGTVGGLIDSLTALAPEKFALVPAARITSLASAYSNLVQSVERAKAQFEQIPTWGGFGRFDVSNGQIVAQNGNPVNAKSVFDDMAASVDNVLEAHIPRVFAALGSRALVLLPSILLLTFASRQHSALFQLREQYSHKYNIAASVHGFKAQAPEFEQPIAGAVFLELLKNPTEGLQPDHDENSNEFVAEIITPAVRKAMEQLRRKSDEKSG